MIDGELVTIIVNLLLVGGKNHLHYGPDFVKYILEKNAVIRTGQMRSRDEGNFISGGASHDYHDNA